MLDIRDYPGALEALNMVLNSGKEAVVKIESDDLIGVAEHTRCWWGQFEKGAQERKKSKPVMR